MQIQEKFMQIYQFGRRGPGMMKGLEWWGVIP